MSETSSSFKLSAPGSTFSTFSAGDQPPEFSGALKSWGPPPAPDLKNWDRAFGPPKATFAPAPSTSAPTVRFGPSILALSAAKTSVTRKEQLNRTFKGRPKPSGQGSRGEPFRPEAVGQAGVVQQFRHISAMRQYADKSPEELRMDDYSANCNGQSGGRPYPTVHPNQLVEAAGTLLPCHCRCTKLSLVFVSLISCVPYGSIAL